MEDMDHYYRVLGVSAAAAIAEIRQAYKDMVKVWHPGLLRSRSTTADKGRSETKRDQ